MSTKIKKQIKKSMPLFLIINLVLSTMIAGIVFNYDFNVLKKIDKKLEFTLSKPEANADMATTTVTVRNAPPSFTVAPAEYSESTSTSPVNIGASIGFNATAHDPETADYFFIVCSTNSVTAHNGAPPTCGQTTFCVSATTTDTNEASCIYYNVTDPIPSAEIKEWYGFTCDSHINDAQCSSSNQGSQPYSLATSSPMYINHAPGFTAIGTMDNFKNPGGTFTVEASSTDPDVTRGAEILHLYVCQTSSWATSTGCAAPLCDATSTSPDISCEFATGTPAVDGNYTYYGYVMDEFSLPSAANFLSNTYTVNNIAPQVTAVILQSSDNIQLNIKNAAEVLASTTSVSVTDNNSCSDLRYATSSIYWSDIANEYDCTANDNNCYQIASTSCVQVAGTCDGTSDLTASYICTTTMAFHALATDDSAGNPNEPDEWLGAIRVFDEALSGVATTTEGVDVITSTALDVMEDEIAYGIVRAGLDTGTSTATTTVVNFGNSPLNTYLYGTNMTYNANTIDIYWQQHDLTYQFDYGDGTFSTSTPPGDLENTDIIKPTDDITNITDNIYWGISIPLGTLSGDYEGHNTFTAALDGSGVGW